MDKILDGLELLPPPQIGPCDCQFQADNLLSTLRLLSSSVRLVEKTGIVLCRSVVNSTLRSHIASLS